mmetsp:Transcript_19452/g.54146  ORF Transcript_19452/g.54146 Transcript_19452/m.54146 type:complete len:200 (-) Transcript_19452:12-611(-)
MPWRTVAPAVLRTLSVLRVWQRTRKHRAKVAWTLFSSLMFTLDCSSARAVCRTFSLMISSLSFSTCCMEARTSGTRSAASAPLLMSFWMHARAVTASLVFRDSHAIRKGWSTSWESLIFSTTWGPVKLRIFRMARSEASFTAGFSGPEKNPEIWLLRLSLRLASEMSCRRSAWREVAKASMVDGLPGSAAGAQLPPRCG